MSKLPRRSFLGALAAAPCAVSTVQTQSRANTLPAGAAVADITLPLGTNKGTVILRYEIASSELGPLADR